MSIKRAIREVWLVLNGRGQELSQMSDEEMREFESISNLGNKLKRYVEV